MSSNPEFHSVDQVLIAANGDRKFIEWHLGRLGREENGLWPEVSSGGWPNRLDIVYPRWWHMGSYRKKIRSTWAKLNDIFYERQHLEGALHRYDHPIRLNRIVDGTRFVKLYGGGADKREMQIPLTMNNLRIPIIPELKERVYQEVDMMDCYPLDIDFEEYELKIWFDGIMRTFEERMVLR